MNKKFYLVIFTISFVLSPFTIFSQIDTDNDGMPDSWEISNNLNPNINDADYDNDGDDLTNIEEYNFGTNPFSIDTDNDTQNDLAEYYTKTDPNDPLSVFMISDIELIDDENDGCKVTWNVENGLHYIVYCSDDITDELSWYGVDYELYKDNKFGKQQYYEDFPLFLLSKSRCYKICALPVIKDVLPLKNSIFYQGDTIHVSVDLFDSFSNILYQISINGEIVQAWSEIMFFDLFPEEYLPGEKNIKVEIEGASLSVEDYSNIFVFRKPVQPPEE